MHQYIKFCSPNIPTHAHTLNRSSIDRGVLYNNFIIKIHHILTPPHLSLSNGMIHDWLVIIIVFNHPSSYVPLYVHWIIVKMGTTRNKIFYWSSVRYKWVWACGWHPFYLSYLVAINCCGSCWIAVILIDIDGVVQGIVWISLWRWV